MASEGERDGTDGVDSAWPDGVRSAVRGGGRAGGAVGGAARRAGQARDALHGHDGLPSHRRRSTAGGRSSRASSKRSDTRSTGRTAPSTARGDDELQQRGQEPADLHGREPRALRRDRAAQHVLEVRAAATCRARCCERPQKAAIIKYVQNGGGIAGDPQRDRHGRRAVRPGTGGTATARTPSSARRCPATRRRTPRQRRAPCRSPTTNHLSTKDLPDT